MIDPQLLVLFGALLVVGLIAGTAAGLFGIGGGLVLVPALYFVFGALGVENELRAHAAVATSLATIVSTSWRSLLAHHKRGAVDVALLRRWAPWIVGGALIGSLVARFVPGEALLGVFGVIALGLAVRMWLNRDTPETAKVEFTPTLRAVVGGGIGFLSSWMGVGGGVFGVMALTLAGHPIHRAVGTAAGFGAAIGAPGAVGFIVGGWGVEGLAPFSIGYVNVPAFVIIIATTFVAAPLGARLAHAMSKALLRRVFAVFLAGTALRMLVESFA